MKYEAEIEGRVIGIDFEERDRSVVAQIGNRRYEAEVVRPEPGVYLFFVGNRVFEARAWTDEGSDAIRIELRDQIYTAKIVDRKHRRPTSDHLLEGQARLTAPMPGKVVRVLLTAGDAVAAGQGVVVVEAMKMQNEVKSPKAGRVIEVRVKQGDTVTAGQLMAIVE